MLKAHHLALFFIVTPLLLLSSSCTKTIFHQTAPYRAGQPTITQPLPIAGLWSIRSIDPKGKLHTIASDHILPEGTLAGFETDQTTHTIYALAGKDRFPLKTPATGNLIWFSRQKVPSHLTCEFDKAMDAAAPVLETTADVAVQAGEAYLDAQSDDSLNDENSNRRPREKRPHH